MTTETTQQTETKTAEKPKAAMVPLTSEDTGRSISAFASEAHFQSALRMANALAKSSLVPEVYRENVPNVLIAMEMANRISASVFAVMQHLNIIHGKPSFDSTFLIASVNASGRFTPLRFRFQGEKHTDDWGCIAVAKDIQSGEECEGELVTVGIARAEGWVDRKGSKWKTMPGQMLRYRAATWWTRIYAPELSVGMRPADEIEDIAGNALPAVIAAGPLPPALVPGNARELEDALMREQPVVVPPAAPSSPQPMPPSEVA